VVIADKSEESTGKWYFILDENGNALGWLEEGSIGSLSPNCPKN
jgi:hypothetical protein